MKSKKLFCLLVAGTMCLLCACGGSSSSSESAVSSSNEATTNESAVATESQAEKTPQSESAASSEIVENPNADFRNACWGDSMETVIANEKIDLESSELEDGRTGLLGETSVGGHSAYAIYYFDDDKLCQGIYGFTEEYSNGMYYINNYNALKDTLKSKYGEPVSDETIKMEKDSLIEAAGEAKALEYGYVLYRVIWETDDTQIMMALMSQNYDIKWFIQYTDMNYEAEPNTAGL